MLREQFNFAKGTVHGSKQSKSEYEDPTPNQDAAILSVGNDLVVGTICDGCGSEKDADIGARITCTLLTRGIALGFKGKHGLAKHDVEEILVQEFQRVEIQLASYISALTFNADCPTDLDETRRRSFPCTAIVLVMTDDWTVVVRVGDGVVFHNGKGYFLDSGERNEPAYLSYGLRESTTEMSRRAYQESILLMTPTREVQSLLIGSDGVRILLGLLPMLRSESGAAIDASYFWRNDEFFKQKEVLSKYLAVVNRRQERVREETCGYKVVKTIESTPGQLTDDTTLIVVRRALRHGSALGGNGQAESQRNPTHTRFDSVSNPFQWRRR